MRNLFFILLILASSVWAKDVYSQGAQEMFTVKSGTIESIFKQIKKQSNYEFFYNTAILDVKQNVMLTSTSGTLDEILAQVLGKKYEYQVKDNYVLISERKVNAPDEVKKVTIKGVVKDKKGELLHDQAYYVKDTGFYYFRVTQDQYDRLTGAYFRAEMEATHNIKKVRYTYDEVISDLE